MSIDNPEDVTPNNDDDVLDVTPQPEDDDIIPQDEPVESAEDTIARLEKEKLEERRKKEHWREKYNRDVVKPTPATPREEIQDETLSDEGKMLVTRIADLEKTIKSQEIQSSLTSIYSRYPAIKDKADDFAEFREENSELSLEKAAKLFLFEKRLPSGQPAAQPRKGLESPTGGKPTVDTSKKLTVEDVKRIRENEPKKYLKMLQQGLIDPSQIK